MVSCRVSVAARMGLAGVIALGGPAGNLWASEEPSKPVSGVVDQAGTVIKNAAARLEHEVIDVMKKFESSETPKKVGNELKRSAEALGETVEQAGKKLKETFAVER